jgi:hypothetical protein
MRPADAPLRLSELVEPRHLAHGQL